MANKTSIKDQIHEILYPGETKNLGHCRWKKKLLFRSANANVKGTKRTWKLLASRKIIIGASGKFLSTSVFSLSVSSAFSLYIYISFSSTFFILSIFPSFLVSISFFFKSSLYMHNYKHTFHASLFLLLSLCISQSPSLSIYVFSPYPCISFSPSLFASVTPLFLSRILSTSLSFSFSLFLSLCVCVRLAVSVIASVYAHGRPVQRGKWRSRYN